MIYMSLYYVRVLLTSPKYVTWTRHLAKLINWTKTHWMKNHKTWTNPVNFILISYTMKFGAFTWIWHSLKWKTKTETFFKKHAIKIAAPILETFENRAYSWKKVKRLPKFGRSKLEQGSAWFKILVVTGYHWLPKFWSPGGYQWLPEVFNHWLQNFVLRVVSGYHWSPEFRSQGGYRLPLATKFDDFDRLSSDTIFFSFLFFHICYFLFQFFNQCS